MKASTSLLTDFYQVTMAYAHWKAGREALPAIYTLSFRSLPYQGGYSIVAGLSTALDYLTALRFSEVELAFLKSLNLFEDGFLTFLRQAEFQCDIEAIPEGTVVFPHEPILKVRGPIWQCQWVESALLNCINFQTLIATKAARLVEAAKGEEVFEFGLRRAQGFDGALSASRAAFIGGVGGTSNVEAARRFGIPLRGTHAHSWIMSFADEQEAFDSFADALPAQCTLLVDTYDTLTGIDRAVITGQRLASSGHILKGVRLDSGDFAYLSNEARRRLDAANLTQTKIIASNELDETLIQSLHLQEAKVDLWGVGTRLVTGGTQSAMSGVYKLSAIKVDGEWQPKIKLSEHPAKTSNPGLHRIIRMTDASGEIQADLIYDESEDPLLADRLIDPLHPHRHKRIDPHWRRQELLEEVVKHGQVACPLPSLDMIRRRVREGLSSLHPGHKRLENPHVYPVGLSPYLSELKANLVARARQAS